MANDLYAFLPNDGTWQLLRPLGTPPMARYGHAAASTGGFLYLAGGISIAGTHASARPQKRTNLPIHLLIPNTTHTSTPQWAHTHTHTHTRIHTHIQQRSPALTLAHPRLA